MLGTRNAKILVMGVGGGGCNAINSMIASGVESAEFVAVNTDAQALELSQAQKKITIGASITKGLGAGARPDVGKQAANESRNELDKALEGVDMLFITAGMGGGTGTGAAPEIASYARDKGILTVGVVTKPFAFEGKVRENNAEEGIANLKKYCDTLIVIPNENLINVLGPKASMVEAFKHADSVLRDAIKGIADLIGVPSMINVDFADVRTIMKDKGIAHLSVATAEGPNKIVDAIQKAVKSDLSGTNIAGATGILLSVIGGTNIGVMETNQAAMLVRQCVSPTANIIFGMGIEEDFGDKVQVLLVATGFEENTAKNRMGVSHYGRDAMGYPMSNDVFDKTFGTATPKEPAPAPMQRPNVAADAQSYSQPVQTSQPYQPQPQARPTYTSIFGQQPQQPTQTYQPKQQSSDSKIPAWLARMSNRRV